MIQKIAANVVVFLGVVVFVGIILSIFLALPVMLLWNWLMPPIFGLPSIGFFEAFGLCFLCNILFKNSNNSKS